MTVATRSPTTRSPWMTTVNGSALTNWVADHGYTTWVSSDTTTTIAATRRSRDRESRSITAVMPTSHTLNWGE